MLESKYINQNVYCMKEKDFTNRELVRKGELEKPLYEKNKAEKEW